jgi:hypothetical protein
MSILGALEREIAQLRAKGVDFDQPQFRHFHPSLSVWWLLQNLSISASQVSLIDALRAPIPDPHQPMTHNTSVNSGLCLEFFGCEIYCAVASAPVSVHSKSKYREPPRIVPQANRTHSMREQLSRSSSPAKSVFRRSV